MWQPRRGYRFGVEVYALAGFALAGGAAVNAVDLGAGSGVVGLLLAVRRVQVTAVEREPRWVALAKRSAEESGLALEVIEEDVRSYSGGPFALAVANPPWFSPEAPRSPDPWRASARTMLHGDQRDFVLAGLRLAPRLCMVTQPAREPELMLPGVYLRRRAEMGRKVLLVELSREPGPVVEAPLDVPRWIAEWRGG